MRDLYLSPDHAVFWNSVLVPVKLWVNGTSIIQVKRAKFTYYHVEMPRHEVLLAEGLTVESYLDLGNRANFQQADTIRLFPDAGARHIADTALLLGNAGCGAVGYDRAGASRDANDGQRKPTAGHVNEAADCLTIGGNCGNGLSSITE